MWTSFAKTNGTMWKRLTVELNCMCVQCSYLTDALALLFHILMLTKLDKIEYIRPRVIQSFNQHILECIDHSTEGLKKKNVDAIGNVRLILDSITSFDLSTIPILIHHASVVELNFGLWWISVDYLNRCHHFERRFLFLVTAITSKYEWSIALLLFQKKQFV